MVYDSLWYRIRPEERPKVLLDFMRLSRFFKEAVFEMQRMGFIHSVSGIDKLLPILRTHLDLDYGSLQILSAIDDATWDQIESFCHDFAAVGRGKVQVKVVDCITACAMDSKSKEQLQSDLENVLHSQVYVDYKVDPSIIGGSIVELEGYCFDSSYKRYLEQVKERYIQVVMDASGGINV